MSIQWVLVATFLYVELFIVLLFVTPFISVKRWHKFFKSRSLQVFARQAHWYYGFTIFALILFLLDSIREMRKYSFKDLNEHAHLETEIQHSMRLFRAQRNFYISGFSLFFSIVIWKFVKLISKQAELMAESEASLKQAKSATAAAESLLHGAGEAAQNSSNEAHQIELNKLTEEIETQKKDIEVLKKDKEALVSQAKSVELEYDRLTEEHRKLQLKLNVHGDGSKKDD